MRYVQTDMRGVLLRLVPLVAFCAARSAWSQPAEPPAAEEPPPDEAVPDTLHEDNEFGPVILIEQIDITGNTATQTEIRAAALFEKLFKDPEYGPALRKRASEQRRTLGAPSSHLRRTMADFDAQLEAMTARLRDLTPDAAIGR